MKKAAVIVGCILVLSVIAGVAGYANAQMKGEVEPDQDAPRPAKKRRNKRRKLRQNLSRAEKKLREFEATIPR